MQSESRTRPLGWQTTAILTLFFSAVAGAAAIGWWYARDSPPHQGPIVLIAADGFGYPAVAGPLDPEGTRPESSRPEDRTGLAALAADAVVFERAYAHSSVLLPAHASLLAGQLPFEHGVRDDGGFVLAPEIRTLAELLRNRGFTTGAAVSSVLLHPDAGVAQGFSFYDAPIPPNPVTAALVPDPAAEVLTASREDAITLARAESWARDRPDQRYFLLVQVEAAAVDAAVQTVTRLLERSDLYDGSTIVVIGNRGRLGPGSTLDEGAVRVPLVIKQPQRAGAGWRIETPVQHIDLVPTLLDLVRAPIPRGLRGRSLKPLLTDEGGHISPQPVYAESLAAYYRLGGEPVLALAVNGLRYVRTGAVETLERLRRSDVAAHGVDGDDPLVEEASGTDMAPLRATLDRLLTSHALPRADQVRHADRQRLARAGYLPGLASPFDDSVSRSLDAAASDSVVQQSEAGVLDDRLLPDQQRSALEAHADAARLLGAGDHAAAIRALQALARVYPTLSDVHFQAAGIASRSGDGAQALAAIRAAAELRPDASEVPALLALLLLDRGDLEEAAVEADRAVALASRRGRLALASAHEAAARVALARHDAEGALAHAAAAHDARPTVPVHTFVDAMLAMAQGDADAARRALRETASVLQRHGSTLEGAHLHRGSLLAEAGDADAAEAAYREELLAYPDSVTAYTRLAELYRSVGRDGDAAAMLEALLQRVPTRTAYTAAARTWLAFDDRARAEGVRSEGRSRFGAPLPALPSRGRPQ